MVMLAVQSLGQRRPVCFARTSLFAAQDSLRAGNVIEAGCKLREATRRYLTAVCEYHDCLPRKEHTAVRMARALRKAMRIAKGDSRWLKDIIEIGDKAANCGRVTADNVRTAIAFLHVILDGSPEVDQPTREGGAV